MMGVAGVWSWWGVTWADALLAISTAVLAVGVSIGIYGIRSSRRALSEDTKARNTAVFLEIGRKWDDPDIMRMRAETYEMEAAEFHIYFQGLKPMKQIKARKIANFFEDLAVLEAFGSLDIQWIEESMGSTIETYWNLWEIVTIKERQTDKRADASLVYENWEALAKKIAGRRNRRDYHHPKKGRWHRRKHY